MESKDSLSTWTTSGNSRQVAALLAAVAVEKRGDEPYVLKAEDAAATELAGQRIADISGRLRAVGAVSAAEVVQLPTPDA